MQNSQLQNGWSVFPCSWLTFPQARIKSLLKVMEILGGLVYFIQGTGHACLRAQMPPPQKRAGLAEAGRGVRDLRGGKSVRLVFRFSL